MMYYVLLHNQRLSKGNLTSHTSLEQEKRMKECPGYNLQMCIPATLLLPLLGDQGLCNVTLMQTLAPSGCPHKS